MKLKYKKLREHGRIDMPAYIGDAGFDVYATITVDIPPRSRFVMPLGIALEFDYHYVCLVNQRSGVAVKKGLDTIGNVIDSSYRGEIHAILVNTSDTTVTVYAGDKIAQLLFHKYYVPEVERVNELSSSLRNDNKFGSTGK